MKYGKIVAVLLVMTGVLLYGCGSVPELPEQEVGVSTYTSQGYEEIVPADVYQGYEENAPADFTKVVITCLEGTAGCYTTSGNTLTFTNLVEDSVYAISGEFMGNIVIDIGDDYKFDLELHGLSMSCDSVNPIIIKSGDRVTLTAKKGYQNYIYDFRDALEEGSSAKAGVIYSDVDLQLAGKGALTIVSENNNGIHSKKDLHMKNLTLTVQCESNALKGNDSVTLENATAVLVARAGDGIKTTKNDVSAKGKQRGTISVTGGDYTIYAACDGIDAAYDVVVDEETTRLNIYTDKYSEFSEEVVAVAEEIKYIRANVKEYNYSVKYFNSENDAVWVNPEYHSEISGGRTRYYYYSFPKMQGYEKMQIFVYSDRMEQGQETEYLATTDYLSINKEYDTLAFSIQSNRINYSWTNFTTKVAERFDGNRGPGGFGGSRGPGGFGGFNEGNSDKGEYSTKGIKVANEIIINNGTINIKSYDDAIHANNDTTLENGESAKGNVIINGGELYLYSNDDGMHADGNVVVKNGQVTISHCYEGIEGNTVEFCGGKISINATDDGVNASATTGTAVMISGGEIYICCTGDGIDSNSRTAYEGIVFSGGNVVIISDSGMNAAIDTERGYKYEGGRVVAVMPNGGMSKEAVDCENFSLIGSKRNVSLDSGEYVNILVEDEEVVTFRVPSFRNGMIIYLGNNDVSVSVEAETTVETDANGVYWYAD